MKSICSRLVTTLLALGVTSLFHPGVVGATILRMTGDNTGTSCAVSDPGLGGLTYVYVILQGNSGATGVIFKAPVPPASGYIYIGATTPFVPTGETPTGIHVEFGECLAGNVSVMQLLLIKTSNGTPCSFVRALPAPGHSSVSYTDCAFMDQDAISYAGAVLNSNGTPSCVTSPADNPSPADGATGVPLSPNLSWSFLPPECPDISGRDDTLYLGTSPNPPSVGIVTVPHQVGTLLPGTKYYWKVAISAYGSNTVSPVWTFTTTAPLAGTPSTWGSIKALYR